MELVPTLPSVRNVYGAKLHEFGDFGTFSTNKKWDFGIFGAKKFGDFGKYAYFCTKNLIKNVRHKGFQTEDL